MSAKRMIILCAAVASVLPCTIGIYFVFRLSAGDVPQAYSKGQRLSFAAFQPNEQIIVVAKYGDRGVAVRKYLFYWAAGQRRVDVVGNKDSFDRENMESLVAGRALTQRECDGLDAMVRYFKFRGVERIIAVGQYRITYIRDQKEIGDELYLGYSLSDDLLDCAEARRNREQAAEDQYQRLAVENGMTLAQIKELLPFETFEFEQRSDEPGAVEVNFK